MERRRSRFNPPWAGGLIHIDASEHVVATGAVGPSDPWYPWAAMGRLVPVGDGTALVATSNPRGDWGSNAVLARVWIRP